jgi:outer membrane lipoprotein SlyB
MKTIRTILLAGAMLLSANAFAQQYGPQDEGRRFNDGSKVVCKNVEVQRSSKDSNRILGTATGAVVGGLLGIRSAKAAARKPPR